MAEIKTLNGHALADAEARANITTLSEEITTNLMFLNTKEPHQYLVTDANGDKVWEDKLCYTSIEEVDYIEEVVLTSETLSFPKSLVKAKIGEQVTVWVDGVSYNGLVQTSSTSSCEIVFEESLNFPWGNTIVVSHPGHGVNLGGVPIGYEGTLKATIHSQTVHIIPNQYLGLNIQPGEQDSGTVISNDGLRSRATGECATSISGGVAMGTKSVAANIGRSEGTYAFAANSGKAKGLDSTAFGADTIATADASFVTGKCNVEDTENKYINIVGNGSIKVDPTASPPISYNYSNAHTLDWNGLGWFAGGLKVGGTGQDDEAAEEVALKSEVEALSGEIAETNKFINLIKQGSTIQSQFTFEETVELVKNGTNKCTATLGVSNMDASTMTLLVESYFATNITYGMSLDTKSILWVRFTFAMSDGTIVTYQLNPDESVTEVTE